MTKDQTLQFAASILGPLLAAEGAKHSPTEIAKRLFELSAAIEAEAKQQPGGMLNDVQNFPGSKGKER